MDVLRNSLPRRQATTPCLISTVIPYYDVGECRCRLGEIIVEQHQPNNLYRTGRRHVRYFDLATEKDGMKLSCSLLLSLLFLHTSLPCLRVASFFSFKVIIRVFRFQCQAKSRSNDYNTHKQ